MTVTITTDRNGVSANCQRCSTKGRTKGVARFGLTADANKWAWIRAHLNHGRLVERTI